MRRFFDFADASLRMTYLVVLYEHTDKSEFEYTLSVLGRLA